MLERRTDYMALAEGLGKVRPSALKSEVCNSSKDAKRNNFYIL
jgi:hypothetical protein